MRWDLKDRISISGVPGRSAAEIRVPSRPCLRNCAVHNVGGFSQICHHERVLNHVALATDCEPQRATKPCTIIRRFLFLLSSSV